MLSSARALLYDNNRMPKQAISITLSPDNLVWLRGRARAEQAGSLSEFLDRLITQARFGGQTPRTPQSMKGALAGATAEPDDSAAISPAAWKAWEARWDDLLAGLDTTATRETTGRRTRRA